MNKELRSSWQRPIRKTLKAALVACLFGVSAAQADIDIANMPLFLTTSIDPNILFILDDSGSMYFEVTPDELSFPGSQYAGFVFPRANNVYGTHDYAQDFIQTAEVNATNVYARMVRSPQWNASYYNPSKTYTPWVRHNTTLTLYPNASITCAWHNPERTGTCPSGTGHVTAWARDLTRNNTQYNSNYWRSCASNGTCSSSAAGASRTFWPATYYWYAGDTSGRDWTNRTTWDWNINNYQAVEIRSTTATYSGHGRENRSDCTAGVCTYAQEIENFANWYTYYRSRMLAARGGIGRAFQQQGEDMRVGYGTINQPQTTIDGRANTGTIVRGVRPFAGTDRQAFFTELYTRNVIGGGTPLRRALDDAGQYYSWTDARGPWSTTPGSPGGTDIECRQSYTILMTDGYWSGGNDNAARDTGRRADFDNSTGPVIAAPPPPTELGSFQYQPAHPFRDPQSSTLADLGMYYWNRDLRTDLANRVPTSPQNPAFWQHMVTFGVGLGVRGSVDPDDAWAKINSGEAVSWGAVGTGTNCSGSECSARLDDLLHAAINSRGGFFSAADPDTFAEELAKTLEQIVARTEASGTAAATSSAVLQTDTLLYTASFRSTDWSGTIKAREVGEDGMPGAVKWDAELILHATTPGSRKIFSQTSLGAKIPLLWENLDATQQTALSQPAPSVGSTTANGQDRVNWLRGTEHAGLRDRRAGTPEITRRIGDLVNSDPQFMFKRDLGYSLLSGTEGTTYKAFRNSAPYNSRPDVLFVGSNGGMLHAFHAGTPFVGDPPSMQANGGKELFAYVPSELLLPRTGGTGSHAQINELMVRDYARRYFVDGTPTVGDAFLGGAWKTVLVGTMGAGGRTVFALDVTDPANFDQNKVLWEFGYSNADCVAGVTSCREVGVGITQPAIGRLSDGTWAAIFANGFNSASHRAHLFVVSLQTGQLIHAIDTGAGSAANPNGLSPAVVTDWAGANLNASRVYAGDLHGNLWRFDMTAAPPTATRLFSATDNASVPQPITARPSIALKPGDPNQAVVLFGTGSFFRVGDDNLNAPQVQTLYGVFDTVSGKSNVARTNLTAQTMTTIASSVTIGGKEYDAGRLRVVSANAVGANGWRVDLPAVGERVISEPTFPSGARQSRVRFTSLIPDSDPCGSGRDGFLMDISLLSGGAPVSSVFDVSGDGVIDDGDLVNGGVVIGIGGPSGERITLIRKADAPIDFLYAGDGTKVVDGAGEGGPLGRQSWRQLR